MSECKICEKEKATQMHHLIPKSIVRKINPESRMKDMLVSICDTCHKAIHFHYLEHIMIESKWNVEDKFGSMKYHMLKKFMKAKYPNIWKDWRDYYKEFAENFEVEDV